MEKKCTTSIHSVTYLRKRKFLLFLPVLIVPFLTLLFWALGGGRGKGAEATNKTTVPGLNLQLPEAHLKEEKGLTKLSFYEQFDKDSLKLDAQTANDPFRLSQRQQDSSNHYTLPQSSYSYDPTPPIGTSPSDPNEKKVYQKLQELNEAMNKRDAPKLNYATFHSNEQSPTLNHLSEQTGLEKTLPNLGSGRNDTADTELQQLNQMMDKILAIQHPEKASQQMKQLIENNKSHMSAVTTNNDTYSSSLLTSTREANFSNDTSHSPVPVITNGFYSLEDVIDTIKNQQNSIEAIIEETQILTEGALAKFCLLNDITIQGILIPKTSFVFGTASLNGERLHIKINSIRYQNMLFPVQLSVYDLDGMKGIYVPDMPARELAGPSLNQVLQGMNITPFNPSLPAQAATAGIEAAKSLFGKKAKQLKVTLKTGYRVLLKNEQ